MTAYTPPAPHRTPLPTRTSARTKVIPHVKNRVGALVASVGLLLALASLYLPWLSTGAGESITALGITEIIDVRSVAPVLFLGLLVLLVLMVLMVTTRLGLFALAGPAVGLGALAAHIVFVWTLMSSTGTAEPTLSGLPADASVTYGPYVAALGFILVTAGSAWAAHSANYLVPGLADDRESPDD